MQKTQKAISVKKLETELKDEKQADFQRYDFSFRNVQSTQQSRSQGGEKLRWNGKKQPKKGSV